MKRDMDLAREILLEIEKKNKLTVIYNLQVEGYDTATIAYHCKILHEAGLISDYIAKYANNDIHCFEVGALTWEGHDYLDKIRDNSRWCEIKDVITQKGLPLIFDTIKAISTVFITSSANAIIENGGQG